MRTAEINRKTNETDISLKLNLDGKGINKIDSGCGFLDHMLTLFARHGGFDLAVTCKGDTQVDYHHTTEDIGIVLGDAFKEALGDMRGITRYGSFLLPMDESLIQTAVDISGRCHLSYGLEIPSSKVGDFDTELTEEFFLGFVALKTQPASLVFSFPGEASDITQSSVCDDIALSPTFIQALCQGDASLVFVEAL